jgi:hypothetical protein
MADQAKSESLPRDATCRILRPPDDQRDFSITWQVELGYLDAQLSVWSDGNAELDLVDLKNMEDQVEHLDINDLSDVTAAISMVVEWMTRRSGV